MTLFKPGMKAEFKLPDGSVVEIPGAELTERALDAAVAQRVFGFTVEWRTNTRTQTKEALRLLDNGNWVVIPYFSQRMSASITLGLRLQDLGWQRTSDPRDPNITLVHADGRTVSASGRSNSEALARAALKAFD